MPVAPYDSDKYREWNRRRMAEYRERHVRPGIRYRLLESMRAGKRYRDAAVRQGDLQLRERGLK
jgi:hypothetical protein